MFKKLVIHFLALALLLALILMLKLPPVPAFFWACGLAASATTGRSCLRMGRTIRRDLGLLARADAFSTPRDGEVVAAAGTLEAIGELLETPVRRMPAVIYYYKGYHLKSSTIASGPIEIVDYGGFGATPCEIRGKTFSVRLGAFPYIEKAGKTFIQSPESIANARDFLRFTRFDPLPPGQMIESMDLIGERWDGAERTVMNFRRGDRDPEQCMYAENSIAAGRGVCAIGVWSAARNSLVATEERHLSLWEASAGSVRAEVASTPGCLYALGVLLVAVSFAVMVYLLSR